MAGNPDLKDATKTYSSFLSLMKWGTAASVALAALVVLLIAS